MPTPEIVCTFAQGVTVGQLLDVIAQLKSSCQLTDGDAVVLDTEGVDDDYACMIVYSVRSCSEVLEDMETWHVEHGAADPPETRCLWISAT